MKPDVTRFATNYLNDRPLSNQFVCYDPDAVTLEGHYVDELSAHRAKKAWSQTLKSYFLLDNKVDFSLKIRNGLADDYVLVCEFGSTCGRYAFWRLINNQALEAQYRIETGHIPNSFQTQDEFLSAPDMRPIHEAPSPMILGDDYNLVQALKHWVRGMISRLKS